MRPRNGGESAQNPIEETLMCNCGWSRKVYPGEKAEEAARYHAIQVHNNIKATQSGKF